MVWFGNSSMSVTCKAACMYLYHFTETLHIMLSYVTSLSIRYIIISRLLPLYYYYYYYYYVIKGILSIS